MLNNTTNAAVVDPDPRLPKYKRKVARIRHVVKGLVFENAALADQIAHMQETILSVKEERKFLLRKLIEYDISIHIDGKPITPVPASNTVGEPHITAAADNAAASTTASPVRARKPYKKRTNAKPADKPPRNAYKKKLQLQRMQKQQLEQVDLIIAEKREERLQREQQEQQEQQERQERLELQELQQQQQLELQEHGEHTEHVQTISVDECGRPIYPIEMGSSLAIYDLGEIVTNRPNYHNENWLYPIGYEATRIYGHMKEPQRKCVYTCKITDGGDYPLFEIIPESDMNFAIAGPSPDLCHAALLQTMNTHSAGRHVEVRPKGEWFFGLGHPTVVTLLLQQPYVGLCVDFVGFRPDDLRAEHYGDATVNYEALQRYMGMSVYHHSVPEVREEPPDQLLCEASSSAVCD